MKILNTLKKIGQFLLGCLFIIGCLIGASILGFLLFYIFILFCKYATYVGYIAGYIAIIGLIIWGGYLTAREVFNWSN